ncbi:hypothetical protein Syun_026876 [Stephania yunnanensis]|uniref:Fumarylacetoacetase n=1 Tax=Stephania yunnanensis TaxID=152371 RepID=A0AAP0HQS5_9MAGN
MATKSSFVDVDADSHFPLQNLPYGVFRIPNCAEGPRPGVAIGGLVLDLSVVASHGLFDGPILTNSDCFQQNYHDKHIGGLDEYNDEVIIDADDEPTLRDNSSLREKALLPMNSVEMVLPIVIGDYTDFYSSFYHAKNCGLMFRPENPIHPNWFQLPIAYHGRASSVVISGSDIIRPKGQSHPVGNSPPHFGPTQKLDFELEMAAVVGPGNEPGKPVDVNEAENHIFGLVLMNDWSGTTISPWIVTLEALEEFACDAPNQDPRPLPYLTEKKSKNYDISLEVAIKPAGEEQSSVVTRSNLKHLYWTLSQQLAHHTINGCNLRPGDLLGTGTISGPVPESLGCLLELTLNGQKPISLNNNSTRKFLEDGDEVVFTGFCKLILNQIAGKWLQDWVWEVFREGGSSSTLKKQHILSSSLS